LHAALEGGGGGGGGGGAGAGAGRLLPTNFARLRLLFSDAASKGDAVGPTHSLYGCCAPAGVAITLFDCASDARASTPEFVPLVEFMTEATQRRAAQAREDMGDAIEGRARGGRSRLSIQDLLNSVLTSVGAAGRKWSPPVRYTNAEHLVRAREQAVLHRAKYEALLSQLPTDKYPRAFHRLLIRAGFGSGGIVDANRQMAESLEKWLNGTPTEDDEFLNECMDEDNRDGT
jgi:hypothetical protein